MRLKLTGNSEFAMRLWIANRPLNAMPASRTTCRAIGAGRERRAGAVGARRALLE